MPAYLKSQIFRGADDIVDSWLRIGGSGIGEPPQFKHQQTLDNLSAGRFGSPPFSLIERLVEVIDRNSASGSGTPGKRNWKFRTCIETSGDNTSPEVTLERALIEQAQQDSRRTKDLGNKMPVCSGVMKPKADKHTQIDLVEKDKNDVSLIELKWTSNTPLAGAIQAIAYGAVYICAKTSPKRFGCDLSNTVLSSRRAQIILLAPAIFFSRFEGQKNSPFRWLLEFETQINKELATTRKELSFRFESFPDGFQWEAAFLIDSARCKKALNAFDERVPLRTLR